MRNDDALELASPDSAGQFLIVGDSDGAVALTRDDLVKYAGPSQIVAATVVFRLFEKAFADLSPRRPPHRDTIDVLVAFPGDGILDCVEMVTRARTRERLTIDTVAGPAEAPPSIIGRFYFEIGLPSGRRGYWLAPGYFDDVFLDLVRKHQDGRGSGEERALYLRSKQELIGRLMGASRDELFNVQTLGTS